MNVHRNGWAIIVSFGFAYLLTVVPLPQWALLWRPDWIVLTLIYWCLVLPQRVGVFSGWVAGLGKDLLLASLMGLYALSLAIVAYITLSSYKRLRVFPRPQQMVIILFMILAAQLPGIWFRGMLGHSPENISFAYSAFSSMLVWPIVYSVLHFYHQRCRVS